MSLLKLGRQTMAYRMFARAFLSTVQHREWLTPWKLIGRQTVLCSGYPQHLFRISKKGDAFESFHSGHDLLIKLITDSQTRCNRNIFHHFMVVHVHDHPKLNKSLFFNSIVLFFFFSRSLFLLLSLVSLWNMTSCSWLWPLSATYSFVHNWKE